MNIFALMLALCSLSSAFNVDFGTLKDDPGDGVPPPDIVPRSLFVERWQGLMLISFGNETTENVKDALAKCVAANNECFLSLVEVFKTANLQVAPNEGQELENTVTRALTVFDFVLGFVVAVASATVLRFGAGKEQTGQVILSDPLWTSLASGPMGTPWTASADGSVVATVTPPPAPSTTVTGSMTPTAFIVSTATADIQENELEWNLGDADVAFINKANDTQYTCADGDSVNKANPGTIPGPDELAKREITGGGLDCFASYLLSQSYQGGQLGDVSRTVITLGHLDIPAVLGEFHAGFLRFAAYAKVWAPLLGLTQDEVYSLAVLIYLMTYYVRAGIPAAAKNHFKEGLFIVGGGKSCPEPTSIITHEDWTCKGKFEGGDYKCAEGQWKDCVGFPFNPRLVEKNDIAISIYQAVLNAAAQESSTGYNKTSYEDNGIDSTRDNWECDGFFTGGPNVPKADRQPMCHCKPKNSGTCTKCNIGSMAQKSTEFSCSPSSSDGVTINCSKCQPQEMACVEFSCLDGDSLDTCPYCKRLDAT